MNIGNRVKVLMECDGKKSIKFERGRIIYMGRRALVEFDRHVCGHDGNGLGVNRKCWMVDLNKIKVISTAVQIGGTRMSREIIDCKNEAKEVQRGLFEIFAIQLSTDKIVFEQKVVADGENEALYESDLKDKLKELKIKRDEVCLIVREIGPVAPKSKPHMVRLLDKVCDFVGGKDSHERR